MGGVESVDGLFNAPLIFAWPGGVSQLLLYSCNSAGFGCCGVVGWAMTFATRFCGKRCAAIIVNVMRGGNIVSPCFCALCHPPTREKFM